MRDCVTLAWVPAPVDMEGQVSLLSASRWVAGGTHQGSQPLASVRCPSSVGVETESVEPVGYRLQDCA